MSDTKTELTKKSKFANKRTTEEVEQHRIFIVEKTQQGFTQQKIADMLYEETGVRLSRGQIGYDLRAVRERWRTTQLDTYEAYINEELAWLDMYERTLWQEWRESAKPLERKKIEEVLNKADGDAEMITSAITTYIEENRGDTRILDLIQKTRQDRRKVLGLYAPSKAVIRTEHVNLNKMKGFEEVSPNDWDDEDVIDGEFSEREED